VGELAANGVLVELLGGACLGNVGGSGGGDTGTAGAFGKLRGVAQFIGGVFV